MIRGLLIVTLKQRVVYALTADWYDHFLGAGQFVSQIQKPVKKFLEDYDSASRGQVQWTIRLVGDSRTQPE